MRILSISLFSFCIIGFSVFGMDQSTNNMQKEPGDYEGYLQDVRWLRQEMIKDYEEYKQLPAQKLSTIKGWWNSYWSLIGLTATPVFFGTVHLLKGAASYLLMKGWIHLLGGVPETDITFYGELGISGAYPILETAYVTWVNKDRKFKEKTD